KDPLWTFELVIKFLTYAVPPLLKGRRNRSRVGLFENYLKDNDIIPGISAKLVVQPSEEDSPLFFHAFMQSQKYRFLVVNSTTSVMSYQKSHIGSDLISPPIRRFVDDEPIVILGARHTLLHGKETAICAFATVTFIPDYPINSSSLQQLKMPFW